MKKRFIILSLIIFSSCSIFSKTNNALYTQLTEDGFSIKNNENIATFIKKLNDPFAKIVKRKNSNLRVYISEPKIGTLYIKIPIFNDENVNDILRYLMRKRLYYHYIIDLRNTTGGDVNSAANFADLFLKKNSLIFQIKKYSKSISYRAKHDPRYFKSVSILINKHTASVAEAVTSTLHHHIKANVIGQNSLGKATIQKQFIVDGNNYLYLTIGYLITSSGEDYHLNGVTPNIYLKPAPINFTQIKDDLAVKTALKLANKAKNR